MPRNKTRKAAPHKKPRRKPGPVAERLKIEGDPGAALDRLLGKKPAKG
jgi:hypothetical protein